MDCWPLTGRAKGLDPMALDWESLPKKVELPSAGDAGAGGSLKELLLGAKLLPKPLPAAFCALVLSTEGQLSPEDVILPLL